MTARAPWLAALLLATLGAGEAAALYSTPDHTIPPTVTRIELISPAQGDTYYAGEWITAVVWFSKLVVDESSSCHWGKFQSPPVADLMLRVEIGEATREMTCDYRDDPYGRPNKPDDRPRVPTWGTVRIEFYYQVQPDDYDPDGISIRNGALVPGPAFRLRASQRYNRDNLDDPPLYVDVDTTLSQDVEIINRLGYKVAGSRQTPAAVEEVDGVAVNSPAYGDTFKRGEVIEVTVTFDRAVDVTGTPQLALAVGSDTRLADYAGGTGTQRLRFRYTVVREDADEDGIGIAADALALNGGTITHSVSGQAVDAVLDLGDRLLFDVTARKVNGRLSVEGQALNFDEPLFSAREGGTLRLGLTLDEPAEPSLSVPWSTRVDGDAATADADADDLGAVEGTVTFAAGETEAVIEIAVLEDSDIEPAREFLRVVLEAPPEGANWELGEGEATLEVQEGVCDRSPAVRDALQGFGQCWAPTSAELAALRSLDLSRQDLSSLRPKDFLGLSGLRALHLQGNRLPSLPEGLFAGLAELGDLNLADNPGAPFPLVVRLVRTDADPWAPGPAQVEARLAEGAPFAMSADLRAEGAELSAASVSIAAGALSGGPLQATPTGGGMARLSLAAAPAVPAGRCDDPSEGLRPCFQGIVPQAGSPLVLFKPAPTPTGQPPAPTLAADGSGTSLALDELIPPVEAGDRLDYRAETDRPDLVGVRIADGLLVLEANEDGAEGTALVTLTATDPHGRSVSLGISVTVEAALRGGLRGWRLEWLRSLGDAAGQGAQDEGA